MSFTLNEILAEALNETADQKLKTAKVAISGEFENGLKYAHTAIVGEEINTSSQIGEVVDQADAIAKYVDEIAATFPVVVE